MDRYLLSGATTLLIIEVALLLGDLGIIPLDPLHLNSLSINQQKIGSILQINQNVRRKTRGSLIWEESVPKDQLYSFDSLLTLSNSSAKIELNEDIQLQLHENTLVVLEPIEAGRDEHLRLKFARGTMRSRTKDQKIDFQAGELVIEAGAGSDINLRSVGDEKIEVEVASGHVKINPKSNGTEDRQDEPTAGSLDAGQRVLIDNGKIRDRQSITDELAWEVEKELYRVYTHKSPVFLHFKWIGKADSIRIVSQEGEESSISLGVDQSEINLPFRNGTFFLSLARGDQISSSLPVSVWPSKRINYLSPLPRDRIRFGVGDIFSWSPSSQAVRYHLQTSLAPDFAVLVDEEVVTSTQVQFQSKEKGPLYWRIVGEDNEGFLIAPSYNQLFYSTLDPLAAPTLIGPSSREPASFDLKMDSEKKRKTKFEEDSENKIEPKKGAKGSFKEKTKNGHLFSYLVNRTLNFAKKLSLVLIPELDAAELNTAKSEKKSHAPVFNWLPVPGADFYIIEISLDPTFQIPVVIQKVMKESFTWDSFSKQVYYWRVAAGQNNGRMGLFSNAAEIDLRKEFETRIAPSGNGQPAVPEGTKKASREELKTKFSPPKEENSSLGTQKESPTPQTIQPEIAEVVKQPSQNEREYSLQFAFVPEYVDLRPIGENQIKGHLQGWSKVTTDLAINIPLREKGRTLFHLRLRSFDWQPKEKSQLPLQQDLKTSTGLLRVLYFYPHKNWGFGPSFQQDGILERTDLETVTWKSILNYGGSIGYFTTLMSPRILVESSLWVTTGNIINSSQWTHRLDYSIPAWGMKIFTGMELNLIYEWGSGSKTNSGGSAGLRFGFEW
ncbi:MAG: hypothetical protein IPJ71_00380 [Bdellovibrionales bacterium]|nr:hypothetical protein [Bdellovibrionales bacterium]